jgi:hypothetical protein
MKSSRDEISVAIFHKELLLKDLNRLKSVQVKVTLRLTVSQSVSLGIEPHLGPTTRYLFLSYSYVLVSVGRPLWWEDGSFVFATGPCQRSLSRVLVPWDLRPYFTVSDLRLPILSPSTTCRVTVEVFDPASTRVTAEICSVSDCHYIDCAPTTQKTAYTVVEKRLPRHCRAMVAARTP